MTSWVRLWHDMPTDPKWRVIARKSGQRVGDVIAVFTFLLVSASANADEFDMLALVALDIRRIAYLPPSHSKQTVHIRPPGTFGGKQFDQYPFDRALVEVGHAR